MHSSFSLSFNSHNAFLPRETYHVKWSRYYQPYHRHGANSLEINYVIDGSCIYHINAQEISLEAKDLLIHCGNNPHDFYVPNSCHSISIICYQTNQNNTAGTLEDLTLAFPSFDHVFENVDSGILTRKFTHIAPLISEIDQGVQNSMADYYMSLLVNKLLSEIVIINSSGNSSLSEEYIRSVKHFIQEHYSEIDDLDAISNELSLNKSYLSRIFKKSEQKTIWNYLNEVRMEQAFKLLEIDPSISIDNVAKMVGIHSRQNFEILFQKIYHATPSQVKSCLFGGRSSKIQNSSPICPKTSYFQHAKTLPENDRSLRTLLSPDQISEKQA